LEITNINGEILDNRHALKEHVGRITNNRAQKKNVKRGPGERSKDATFEIFTTVKIQLEVLWVVTPCSFVVGCQRFKDPCCLHLLGCDDV
jgi:hypothetical protein